jgi:hypothetical protein
MLIYSLVVEGLYFAQADIFGEYLPTKSSVEAVLSKLGNPNLTKGQKRIAEQDFCTLSYGVTELLDKQINADIYLTLFCHSRHRIKFAFDRNLLAVWGLRANF